MKRVVFNRKGGVGKSTIACNLAAVGASRGRSSLIIDLDTQGNSTQYLLGDEWSQAETNVARFFENSLSFRLSGTDPAEFCVETPFSDLWVMPASPDLSSLETKLEAKHKIYKLKEAMDQLAGEVDDIYVDTPPAFNFYTFSALIGAEKCLIPFDCDDFSRRALNTLLENIGEIRADHNPGLEVEGIVVNQFQARSRLPQRVVEELLEEGQPVLEQKISPSIIVKESHEAAQPLIYFAPRHKVTGEFVALYDSLSG